VGGEDWRVTAAATAAAGYAQNLDRLTVYVDSWAGSRPLDVAGKLCGFVSRLRGAVFRRRVYVECVRPLSGRHVYVEATGSAAELQSRPHRRQLFSAVLCEVLVYQ